MNSTAIWALRTAFLAAAVLAAAMTPQPGQASPQSSTPEPAIRSSPKNAAVYLERGDAYLHAKKYAQAAEAFKTAVAIEPANAAAHFGLAMAYMALGQAQEQRGKLHEAAASYDKAIASNPSQDVLQLAHKERGLLHFQLKQYQAAIGDFQEVLKVDPEDKDANLGLARSYMQDRQTPNAMRTLRAFVARHPENSDGHFYLGLCYLVLGNRPFAEHEYQTVLGLDKKTAHSMRELLDTP